MAETYGLTDRFVASVKAAAGAAQTDYFEPNRKWRGLAIRVSRTGLKTWCYFFTWNGKRVRMSLGSYPSVTVAEAHTYAIEARGYLDAKPQIDPRDRLRKTNPGAMKIAELTESYLTLRARPHLRSANKIEWTLRKHVLPVIGPIILDDLTKREVNRVIDPVVASGKKVAAARTFQILRAMFSWAVSRGDLDANPMDTMTKPEEQPLRKRTLSDDEIKVLWNALPTTSSTKSVERILKLCLLTGQRIGEVSGMAMEELNLEARKWIIPDYRAKNKQDHEVPLSPPAIALIQEAITDAGDSKFVFPGLHGEQRISSTVVTRAVAQVRKSIGLPHWSAHDLRRTVATHMQRIGVMGLIISHVLNHRSITRGTVTQRHYLTEPPHRAMREALELWADRLAAITSDRPVADVVPIQGVAS